MADISFKNLFGVATTAANVRLNVLNLSYLQLPMCQAFAVGFNMESQYGNIIYNIYNSSQGNTTNGFGTTFHYQNYEAYIFNTLASFLPNETESHIQNLVIAAHAMIFGYALSSTVDINDFVITLGLVLYNVASIVNNNQPFQITSTPTTVYVNQPFNQQYVLNFIQSHNYDIVVTEINNSPINSKTNLVNYNWYNTYNLFPSPNLQIMQDIENQYYYISGELIYQNNNSLPECIEDPISINTPTGIIKSTFIRNTPCFENGSYIGPPSSLEFSRIFNDGPSSSGHFSSAIQSQYISWDENVLNPASYLSNSITLYSYLTDFTGGFIPISLSNTFIDANGVYSLTNTEYQYTPDLYNCTIPQRMHIGDNLPRSICSVDSFGHCNCSIENVTGFKFASLSLPNNYINDFSYILTNPVAKTNGVLTRALNLNSSPYLATSSGGQLNTFINPLSPVWYFGPPQLSGGNQLPELAFFQKFNNPTFGDYAEIVIYPSIGTSYGSTGIESIRNYTYSTTPIFSGVNSQNNISFLNNFNSNDANYDSITKQFFSIGDNFQNQYINQTFLAKNAGFSYTGNLFTDVNGNIFAASNITGQYITGIIGSPFNSIQYISGYSGSGYTVGMSQMYGQNISGNPIAYYYIDGRLTTNQIQETGMTTFAQLPTGLEHTGTRIYNTQGVENYLPRFQSGPYSVENQKFLYPNALLATQLYTSKLNGFPVSISYQVEVREESLGELYGYYNINSRGIIDTTPTLTPTIRVLNGNISGEQQSANIFDSQNNFVNFNLWPVSRIIDDQIMLSNYVNNNYAPSDAYGNPILNKNNISSFGGFKVFTDTENTNIFENGLRITGNQSQKSRINNATGFYYIYAEMPLNSAIYHGYRGSSFTGKLYYTLPLFDLNSSSLLLNQCLQNAFPQTIIWNGITYDSYGTGQGLITTGEDPLFLQNVGGRSGDAFATSQGSFNKMGIIGDEWLSMTGNSYGIGSRFCNSEPYAYFRNPQTDDTNLLFNSTPLQTSLWTNGLKFSPFKVNRNLYRPFNTNTSLNYNFNNTLGQINTILSGDRLVFDISQFFPLKPTGSSYNFWYNQSGLTIGPFDRDVEFGISYPDSVIAYTDLYVNYKHITQLYLPPESCEFFDIPRDILTWTGIRPELDIRTLPYSILDTIKQGEYLNLNIFSNPIIGGGGIANIPAGYPSETMIGILPGAKVSIRAFKPLDSDIYDINVNSGEQSFLDVSTVINNGYYNNWTLNHNGFQGLNNQTYQFITYADSGKIYPIPGSDFTSMGTTDAFSNLSYPANATVEEYWIQYCRKNNTTMKISGYREGSRVSFKFSNINVNFGKIPYQTYPIVTASGTCTFSGKFGYFAQADNSIYSAGVILTDNTPNDPLASLFNPIFVSEVLNRLPWISDLTGNFNNPTFAAPSVMEQRKFVSGISANQTYIGINNAAPNNYNKFWWPALSDLETLNHGETLEAIPADDGNTFNTSNIIFSASQGQRLPNGRSNPVVNKTFDVSGAFQTYDSISTDALLNSGVCITSGRGQLVRLQQTNLSGAIAPPGTSIILIENGLN